MTIPPFRDIRRSIKSDVGYMVVCEGSRPFVAWVKSIWAHLPVFIGRTQ